MRIHMYLTTHAAVGVLIGQSVDRPLWAFLWSLLSHLILDFIPHGDDMGDGEKDTVKWVPKKLKLSVLVSLVDLSLLTAMLIILYASKSLPRTDIISAAIIGSVLPDIISNVFPVLHYYTSWLAVVRLARWVQRRPGVHHLWRTHDWFHRKSHYALHWKLTVKQGILLQSIITIAALVIAFRYRLPGLAP